MILYTLCFAPEVSQEVRHKVASDFESLHWEIERLWDSKDILHPNHFNLVKLNITCWDSKPPKLPFLPEGCFLEKL